MMATSRFTTPGFYPLLRTTAINPGHAAPIVRKRKVRWRGRLPMSKPTEHPLFERDSAGSTAITAATPNTATPGAPYVSITANGHGCSDGDTVLVFGIAGSSDDVNDQWTITAPDANTLYLRSEEHTSELQ